MANGLDKSSLMKLSEQKRALAAAVSAARAAGRLMRRHLNAPKHIHTATHHDIKLELDVRSQKLIERALRRPFPAVPVLGEEGVLGDPDAAARWVVDPIDGTVNFTYGIPHSCVAIALQVRKRALNAEHSTLNIQRSTQLNEPYETVVGVVYDPFTDELWTAIRGQPARLNGRVIRVSRRQRLREAILALGFAKEGHTLERMLPVFNSMIHRVRKIRVMGVAALALVYVASGRFDVYIEYGIKLWDIAAGGLILESAGGEFWRRAVDGRHTYRIIANNGLLRRRVEAAVKS